MADRRGKMKILFRKRSLVAVIISLFLMTNVHLACNDKKEDINQKDPVIDEKVFIDENSIAKPHTPPLEDDKNTVKNQDDDQEIKRGMKKK